MTELAKYTQGQEFTNAFTHAIVMTASSHSVFWWIIGRGVVCSLSSIFYLIRKRYMYTILHIFVVLGAMVHYQAIMDLLAGQ